MVYVFMDMYVYVDYLGVKRGCEIELFLYIMHIVGIILLLSG